MLHLKDLDMAGKKVVIREDLNVPVKDGKVKGDNRIVACLPTIKMALDKGAAVVLLSHLGRPEEGVYDEAASLAPVAARLATLLGMPVPLIKEYIDGVDVAPGHCVLCENVRFLKGEKKNSDELARKYAALGDIYVMDAFGSAHRAQASTEGAIRFAKTACAGPLLGAEVEAFARVLEHPARPVMAILGGAKVSTKLALLDNLLAKVDRLLVGGGIANTFLAAAGFSVGKSLYEPELLAEATRILEVARSGGKIPLPVDAVVASEMSAEARTTVRKIADIQPDDMILDIGPETIKKYREVLSDAQTIVWNGPVGAFEIESFSLGTRALAETIAQSNAYSVVGGGDVVAAIEQFKLVDKMSYVSTGGGAFLEVLEGITLPSIAALNARG